ncbi:GNAT family N-acetyltransferase [Aestuariimicrobium sp. T2.26MG-19.2B]|uniref:GNAT family N-acetyltransferase n=1 Tax=Aestuariimicrobium sp. T2.26MG-19.2B TaxID=3040679 RepID=UPI0025425934|nr:GNAT family N-acetyltransferase [Aestuariimicrobium sp. T2.26MG-19.2B]
MTRELPLVNPGPTPQVAPGVRLAMPVEAWQLAEIQRREWTDDPLMRRFLDETTLEQMAEIWHTSITRPPLASMRVLVATEPEGAPRATGRENETQLASRVVGFAVVGPAQDEDATGHDGELSYFRVDPMARGRGHTSRLLNAAVDTLRADRFTRATCWVRSTDDDFRALLVGTGWAPDGGHQELGTEDGVVRVKQVRLHTDISSDGQ